MSETVEFDFQPLANGMDFLKSAIAQLQDDSQPSNLKYAVLHLQAAAEVLLKVRLMREHWALAFKEPGSANPAALKLGDFQSVGVDETLKRLKGIAAVDLSASRRGHITRLGKERNKLQHFGTTFNKHEIGSIAGKALDTLLAFVVDHLIPDAPEAEAEVLTDVKELLEEALEEVEVLGRARRQRLQSELVEIAGEIIACPRCTEMAFRFSERDRRCYFCEHAWESGDPYELAEDYVGNVLVELNYKAFQHGEDLPLYTCPDCESDTLVGGVTVMAAPKESIYLCFACETVYQPDEIGGCSRCHQGVYVRTPVDKLEEDGEIDICSSCWDYMVDGD